MVINFFWKYNEICYNGKKNFSISLKLYLVDIIVKFINRVFWKIKGNN